MNAGCSEQLNQAAKTVKQGGILVYPTEAVYALGCDFRNEKAVLKLLKLKQRDVSKGLILIASHVEQILPYIKPASGDLLAKALKTWPGHHTWVFKKSNLVADWISGKHSSVAVRVSAHPGVKALCNELGHALVSTSANLSGSPVPIHLAEIKNVFSDTVDYYLDMPLGGMNSPSTIVDAQSEQVIRH